MTDRRKSTLSNLARRLNLAAGATHLPALYFMTDEKRVPDPINIIRSLPKGTAVILRHYAVSNRDELAKELKKICQDCSLYLFVAADARLANKVAAHGLHLRERDLLSPDPCQRLWIQTAGRFVTAAVHSERTLLFASKMGVNAALVSPVFPTKSHPGEPAMGILRLSGMSRLSRLPVVALGGITDTNACRLAGSACSGIAAVGGLIAHPSQGPG